MRPANRKFPFGYLALLLLTNLSLLLPAGHILRVSGALLLVGLLPGLSWSLVFFPMTFPLLGWVIAAALSYSLTSAISLGLHYLPGPIHLWQLLLALNLTAVLPLLLKRQPRLNLAGLFKGSSIPPALGLILAVSLFLRAANLHYSEFQGDEALAMIAAAEALEGHEDALFLRAKGPGEVLLPLALWRLTGVITEAVARLPFMLAALLAIVTTYLIGQRLAGPRLGWLAAGIFSLNGFMVAFGRIVQYQALVVWFSALAFLLALEWQGQPRRRLALLSGLVLGSGLLAHYDAILTLPAVGWLFLIRQLTPFDGHQPSPLPYQLKPWETASHRLLTLGKAALFFTAALLVTTLPFYLPYLFDPQANRTGAYVGGRIGDELRNNLPDFFHFNSFYSSWYFIVLTGMLVTLCLLRPIWAAGRPGRIAAAAALAGVGLVVAAPALLDFPGTRLDLSFLPFALLLGAAFAALFLPQTQQRLRLVKPAAATGQALILWLAVPFLGYNFVVALGLTHIYTIVPAWSLLAALGWRMIEQPLPETRPRLTDPILAALLALFALFLWNAFVRHDVEYAQDYPAGNLALFWSPYRSMPEAGLFGFAHRAGWKAVGQKISDGALAGDYGSNEEPDVTTWYTRGAPRACDPQPEFYILAGDLVDPVPVPMEMIASRYAEIGAVWQANGKHTRILQLRPVTLALNQLDEAGLSAQFDQTAAPAAFARSARGSRPAAANFGNVIRLVGYDLNTQRAYPGGRLPVTLYWQALAPVDQSYQVFAHLEGAAGPLAQADGVPVCWTYPTNTWRAGQIIADQHAIALPSTLAPGQYPLTVGLYRPDTFQRLDVLDEAGNPAGTGVTLAVVAVRDEGGDE